MKTMTRFGIFISVIIIALVACSNNERSDATESPTVVVNDGPIPVTSSTPTTPVTPVTAEAVRIEITATGFEPKELTVAVGTTVEWTNNDTQSHWVASDPYPIHTNLVGFEADQALERGATYRYTFTKTGTWTYHDHSRPITYTGQVTVTE